MNVANPAPLPMVKKEDMSWGANALAAPATPDRRLPVVDKSKVDPELLKGAQGMEAMFLDYMMKVMRESVPDNEMGMDSPAVKLYTGMRDSEMAKTAAEAGGVGLADQIIAYMSAQRYNLPKGNPYSQPQSRQPGTGSAGATEVSNHATTTGQASAGVQGGIHESR